MKPIDMVKKDMQEKDMPKRCPHCTASIIQYDAYDCGYSDVYYATDEPCTLEDFNHCPLITKGEG